MGDEKRLVRWLLLDGSRMTIVTGLSVGVFLTFLGLGSAGIIGVSSTDLVTDVFSAAITGVFTLVSVTISINQLVLSRIIGSPRDIHERMESVHRFRTQVEEMDPQVSVSPTEPADFLEVLVRTLRERAVALRTAYDEHHDPCLIDEVDDLVDTLLVMTDNIDDSLDSDRLPLFQILSTILNNSYSIHLYTVSRIQSDTDNMSESERQTLDSLSETLNEINLARHYFKTLYLHIALARVSRLILITGLPALVISFVVILAFGEDVLLSAGGTLGLVLVSAAIAIVSVPLIVLFSYGLRVATIAKRTATFGVFTPVEESPEPEA